MPPTGDTRPRVVLAARDLHPFCGGGIAPVVAALARTLSATCAVTLLTSDGHRDAWARLGRPDFYGDGVEVLFAAEPRDPPATGFLAGAQAWSAALYAAITERFAGGGPDLIEFADYLAEGFVTLQARRTGDPTLAATRIVVRAHTTAEIVSVLDGALADDLQTRVVLDMERYCLRHADRLLTPGGDIRASYERFYGADALAPSATVLDAFERGFDPPSPVGEPPGGGLRLLVLGRLERRKGPQLLVRALRSSEREDWRVTFLGDDTDTAPLGLSMRAWLEGATSGDERFAFRDAVPRREVGRVIAEHDLVVVPSLWECWPNTVREAYAHGRPVLATPVGGLPGLVEHGVTGWLASDASPAGLRAALAPLLDAPEAVRALRDAPALAVALGRLDDPDRVREDYARLATLPRPAVTPPWEEPPLVSVVVPYFRMARHLAATLACVRAQTWPQIEIVVVNDGSFAPEDRVLLELGDDVVVVTQPNRGLGAARNLGVSVARGDYLVTLDPDDLIAPDHVASCMAALATTPDLAYVTTWARYIDERGRDLALPDNGYTALGNWSPSVDGDNVAGVSVALFRRSAFDDGRGYDVELTSYEDWFFYRALHHAGLLGDVIPRRLYEYRVRADSMMRTIGFRHVGALEREMRARRREAVLTGGAA